MRLKRPPRVRQRTITHTFQYQKGAIKTRLRQYAGIPINQFQYQKGAIKTRQPACAARSERPGFQYQKGAIKTVIDVGGQSARVIDFNTKKVRLKQECDQVAIYDLVDFNTKKVRLKPVNVPAITAMCLSIFQYQKGAIKTVRFFEILFRPPDFNTKKVRLKLVDLASRIGVMPNFNTKKVRLKRRVRRADYWRLTRFQYQKGAIKTFMVGAESGRVRITFQYQKGAIKTL